MSRLKSVTDRLTHIQQWLIGISGFLLAIMFTATRIAAPGSVTPWPAAFKIAAVQWMVWLLAGFAIVQLDKSLPLSREALMSRLLLHVPASLVVAVFTTYVSAVAVQFAVSGGGPYATLPETLRESWRNGFYTHVMIYWAIVGIYLAYQYHQRLLERELRTAKLEKLVSESQLQALRSQLHPHFLFNSLNAISAYVERSPRMARKMLEQLGALLRLSLEHSNDHEIRLREEIAFIRNYLELQQVRFEGRLEVKIEADPAVMDAFVPTFILQPIVENAIRYGMGSRSGKSALAVGARSQGERLVLTVQDDGPGLPPDWNIERDAGIGISNTRERLRCLYETNQLFEISSGRDGGGVLVRLSIPFHPGDSVTRGRLHDEYSRASR